LRIFALADGEGAVGESFKRLSNLSERIAMAERRFAPRHAVLGWRTLFRAGD